MIREIVVVSICVVFASAFKYEDIPEEYRELIPEEAKSFLTSLSDSDKAALKEIYANPAYKNSDEIVAAIKKKSPELGARAEKYLAMLRTKVAALGPDAKPFAEEMMESARKIRAQYLSGNKPSRAELKKAALGVINKYKTLSDAGKADFQKQFPILSKILTSEKLAKRLEALN